MPEETKEKVEEAVETTEETKSTEDGETTEITEEAEKTVAEAVADVTGAQPSEDTVDDAETSEPLVDETPTETKTDDKTSEDEDVSSFLEDETIKKTGLEKRVDKLTAEKYEREAKIARLEAQIEINEKSSPTSKNKRYTNDELARAMMKAHEDGDANLMAEILKQQETQIKQDLRSDYDKEQNKQREAAQQNRREWTEVVKNWEYLSDESEPELYTGSRNELDIRGNQSLLRQVALLLYNSEQEDLFQRYHRPGGQELAVQDAFKLIIKKRRGVKSDNTQTKSLKKRLVKERRKTSLAGSGKRVKSEPTKKPKKPRTQSERLDDYINDRRSRKSKATESLGLVKKE